MTKTSMTSQEIEAQIEILKEEFERAVKIRDDLWDEENEARNKLDDAEDLVFQLEDKILKLQVKFKEALFYEYEEADYDTKAHLDRYYANRDERQGDLDL